jgi:hypothetical protein
MIINNSVILLLVDDKKTIVPSLFKQPISIYYEESVKLGIELGQLIGVNKAVDLDFVLCDNTDEFLDAIQEANNNKEVKEE